MKKYLFLLFLITILNGYSQNPIVPPGTFIADPSAHVWKDGKMYVYGSRDESPKYYCSLSYRVLSSSDLNKWDLSDVSFSNKARGSEVSFMDDLLLAPDVQYHNGKYYLYYCMFNFVNAEWVAESNSPTGPFTNNRPIYTKKINQIDPCVFIDDDGQGYYIWGQFNAKIAKLKPNMTEIDTTSIKENIVTQKEHYFHEGAYMIKRKELYYLIYSDMSRAGRPTCLGYATSRSPMGPFKYQGVIIDNNNSDPVVWNNHGSLVAFKDKWYVFYHRATNGSISMRKACLEPITFRADGTIPEVEMTSQGAAPSLNAFEEIDAARACLVIGNIRIKTFSNNNEGLANILSNDKAAFKYLDFKEGASSISIKVAPSDTPCVINLNIDDSWGTNVGKIEVPAKQNEEWISLKVPVKIPKGVHSLWLQIIDPKTTNFLGFPTSNKEYQKELVKIDSFQFEK